MAKRKNATRRRQLPMLAYSPQPAPDPQPEPAPLLANYMSELEGAVATQRTIEARLAMIRERLEGPLPPTGETAKLVGHGAAGHVGRLMTSMDDLQNVSQRVAQHLTALEKLA